MGEPSPILTKEPTMKKLTVSLLLAILLASISGLSQAWADSNPTPPPIPTGTDPVPLPPPIDF